jgi:hypothetical protein
MIPDLLIAAACGLIQPILDSVNASWTSMDFSAITTAVQWFWRLNDYIPLGEGLACVVFCGYTQFIVTVVRLAIRGYELAKL